MPRFVPFLAVGLIILLSACSRGERAEQTTSAPTTSIATSSTAAAPQATTQPPPQTSAAQPSTSVVGLPDYSVMSRTSGDEVVVLIDPDSTYSDIDLRNVVEDVLDRFAPVTTLHIVDDEAAVGLVGKPDPTPEEQALLDDHYLLRLEDGFRIVFEGPFSDLEDVIVGS